MRVGGGARWLHVTLMVGHWLYGMSNSEAGCTHQVCLCDHLCIFQGLQCVCISTDVNTAGHAEQTSSEGPLLAVPCIREASLTAAGSQRGLTGQHQIALGMQGTSGQSMLLSMPHMRSSCWMLPGGSCSTSE